MRTITVSLLLSACAFGQSFNTIKLIPVGGTASSAQFYDNAGTNYIGLVSPATLSGNTIFTLMPSDGTAGQCIQTNGGAVLSFGSCSGGTLTPPITFSGTISSPILTILQGSSGGQGLNVQDTANSESAIMSTSSGSNSVAVYGQNSSATGVGIIASNTGGGPAFEALGDSSVSANDSNTALTVNQSGTGDALQVSGITELLGLVTQNGGGPATWYIGGNNSGSQSGSAYFQDTTSRYVFNSAGDVPQTGTINVSAGNVVTLLTGGPFDQSWAGGQLLVCPGGTCTTSNGTFYLVGNPVTSGTSLTLVSGPGALSGAAFSYQANAFQTSTGTMRGSGTGFWYAQNYTATYGFTAYPSPTNTGTVTCSGTSVVWASGSLFDESMVGNQITINGGLLYVASFLTPTSITVNSACTSGSYSFVHYAFALSNNTFFVDNGGNETAQSILSRGQITATSTGDAYLVALGAGAGGKGILALEGSAGTANCWFHQANGSGSTMLIQYASSCNGAYSPTTEVTYTPSAVTFAQPINVPGCTGCSSGGVTAFNTRTGSVSLTSTDVSNAGGNGIFGVTSASDAYLAAIGSSTASSNLELFANAGANCWNWKANGGGANLVLGYTSSCSGVFSLTTELTMSPSAVTFAQPISAPNCCTSGVTSVSGSGLISSSGGPTPVISCSSCQATIAGGTGVNLTGGGSTINIGQAVATTSNVTFNFVTSATGYDITGIGNIIDSSANYLANSVKISGITSNSGGALVCVTGAGLLYRITGASC